jgi:hypothetical protein
MRRIGNPISRRTPTAARRSFHQHDGEGQQKHGGCDDRDDRNRQVKAPQHEEWPGRFGRPGGRLGIDARHPRPDVA